MTRDFTERLKEANIELLQEAQEAYVEALSCVDEKQLIKSLQQLLVEAADACGSKAHDAIWGMHRASQAFLDLAVYNVNGECCMFLPRAPTDLADLKAQLLAAGVRSPVTVPGCGFHDAVLL